MKSRLRGERRLAALRRELRRLRLGYARSLAKKIKVRGALPARILAIKAKIAQVARDVERRETAA